MKYIHEVNSTGPFYEKLVMNGRTVYQAVPFSKIEEQLWAALMETGDWTPLRYILVRTQLKDLEDGSQYGRYVPLEICMVKRPWYCAEVEMEIMELFSPKAEVPAAAGKLKTLFNQIFKGKV